MSLRFIELLHIKSINNISAWVVLKDESQAKAMNSFLPKLRAIHRNIVLLPWSVYYNMDDNTTTSKGNIDNKCPSAPPKDNLDSVSKDEQAAGKTLEKVPCISKGLAIFILIHCIWRIFCIYLYLFFRYRVSKGDNISPMLEGAAGSVEIGNIITISIRICDIFYTN